MKNITLIAFSLFSTQIVADEIYDQGLFGVETKQIKIKSEQQFKAYIKDNMPKTFVYFQRLNSNAQKRVYTSHLENTNQDITELVLLEYRNRS
ncbi:MAG: hypothetical protein R3E90_13145 [Marinicella sp.]